MLCANFTLFFLSSSPLLFSRFSSLFVLLFNTLFSINTFGQNDYVSGWPPEAPRANTGAENSSPRAARSLAKRGRRRTSRKRTRLFPSSSSNNSSATATPVPGTRGPCRAPGDCGRQSGRGSSSSSNNNNNNNSSSSSKGINSRRRKRSV